MRKRGKVRKISTSSSRFRSIGIEVQPSTPEVEMSHRKKKRKRKRKKEKGKEKEKSCEKKFQARLAIFFFFFLERSWKVYINALKGWCRSTALWGQEVAFALAALEGVVVGCKFDCCTSAWWRRPFGQRKKEEKEERVLISDMERGGGGRRRWWMMMDGIIPYSWQHFDLCWGYGDHDEWGWSNGGCHEFLRLHCGPLRLSSEMADRGIGCDVVDCRVGGDIGCI